MTSRRALLSVVAVVITSAPGCLQLMSASTAQDRQSTPAPDSSTKHWSHTGDTTDSLVVLGYQFRAATIQNGYADKGDVCVIYATVEFTAPSDEYMRFQAKVTMTNGAWVKSPIFYNDSAGSREFTFNFDTRPDECWGARPHIASNLHVAGCRGVDCDPAMSDQPPPDS